MHKTLEQILLNTYNMGSENNDPFHVSSFVTSLYKTALHRDLIAAFNKIIAIIRFIIPSLVSLHYCIY